MIKQIWKTYYRYLKISFKESFFSLFLGILGAFCETFSIYLLANLITNFANSNTSINIEYFEKFDISQDINIILFLIIGIFSAYLYYLSNKNIVNAKCKIERFIREEITNITLNIKWEYFLKLSQGDISKSIIAEGQNISEGYMYFLQSFSYFAISIIYFIICLIFVPDTSLILIFYGFLAFRVYIYFSKKAEIYGKELSEITSNIGIWTSSIFNNLKYIRTISKDDVAKIDSKKIFLKFSNSYSKARIASYKSKFVTEILTLLFIFIAIIYILVSKSNTSNLILSLSLFIRITPKVYNAQTRLLDSVAMISWPKLHYEKINWAKKYCRNQTYKEKKSISFDGNIIFNSVSFSYPNSDKIIDNLNLKINRNESIGIFGKSGCGKSTFVDLLSGIIKPQEGNIMISGVNMKNININDWRKQLGIVMQDNYFKNQSLKDNIALGEKDIDTEKIKEALKKANAWKFVKKIPNGINEKIYDKGMRFSGGERQKIALARALYSEPEILILDEPTTGLDENSEMEFINSIKELLGSLTIIIISHKREVVNICDSVLLFENKRIQKI